VFCGNLTQGNELFRRLGIPLDDERNYNVLREKKKTVLYGIDKIIHNNAHGKTTKFIRKEAVNYDAVEITASGETYKTPGSVTLQQGPSHSNTYCYI
jgi:hypothetical protein